MSRGRRWLFKVLLMAYPHAFRAKHANDIMEFMDDAWTDGSGRVKTITRLLRDALSKRLEGGDSERTVGLGTEPLRRDFVFGVRRLARQPAFSTIAVLSLALGIGANTLVFSLVNAVLLKSAPFGEPQSLVELYLHSEHAEAGGFSVPDYRDVREALSPVLSGVSAVSFALTGVGDVRSGLVEVISGDYFSTLQLPPLIGRTFTMEDDQAPGGHPVAMIAEAYWRAALGASSDVLGRDVLIGGRPYQIVGVVPASYSGLIPGARANAWMPLAMLNVAIGSGADVLSDRTDLRLFLRGRLRDGVTHAAASAALATQTERMRTEWPQWREADRRIRMERTEDVLVNPALDKVLVPAAAMLLAAAGVVLLIACTNLASFFLAQGSDRQRELSVRRALGAGRGTLIRQLLMESVTLSACGAATGVLLARLGGGALLSMDLPVPIQLDADLELSLNVLIFTGAVTAVASLVFGLVPALEASRAPAAGALRARTPSARSHGIRSALIVGQMALVAFLLVGSGLFLRSLEAFHSVELGFGEDSTAGLAVKLPADAYTRDQAEGYFDELVRQVSNIAEVEAVGLIDVLPLSTTTQQRTHLNADGTRAPEGQSDWQVDYRHIDEGFMEAASIELVAGRGFEPADRARTSHVAIASQTLADQLWGTKDVVGRSVKVGALSIRIVGVAEDIKVRSLGEAPRALIYYPLAAPAQASSLTLVARSRGAVEPLLPNIEAVARALGQDALVPRMVTLGEHVAVQRAPTRLAAQMLGVFALVALCLSCIGLFGIVHFAVSRRTREMGVRISLGAAPGSVVLLAMRRGVGLSALGAGIGVLLMLVLVGPIQGLLFGVNPRDPLTFVVVPLALVVIACVAAYLPARRASRVDPVRALRAD